MLPEPALLTVEQGYPLYQGRLNILEGPERLETGWWDDERYHQFRTDKLLRNSSC